MTYPFYQPKEIAPEEYAADRENERRIMAGQKKSGYTNHKGIRTKDEIFAQRVYNEKMLKFLDDR